MLQLAQKLRYFAYPAMVAIALCGFASSASALTRQQVIVQFDPTPDDAFNSDETRDSDSIDDSGGPIDQSITAQIGGPGGAFFARGSVGEFGNLGVEGNLRIPGELDSQVFIESDGFQNISGKAQSAALNFIIDGGRFAMIAGEGSLLEFSLTIRKDFDVVFQTAFEFESLDNTGVNNELRLFGEDVGVVQNSFGQLDMDFSFNTADLGVIQPNEQFGISYQLDITGTAESFSEIFIFEFSDPFDVTGFGDFPTVEFSDLAAVPLPAAAPMMAFAFGALAFAASRRRHRR